MLEINLLVLDTETLGQKFHIWPALLPTTDLFFVQREKKPDRRDGRQKLTATHDVICSRKSEKQQLHVHSYAVSKT